MKQWKRHHLRRLFDPKKLFDWWSVPHFLFGIITALVAIAFDFPAFDVFFVTFGLALSWELLEKFFRLSEAPGNGWVDVVLPLMAFVMTYFLVDQAALNHDHHIGLLTITLLLYCFINMIAWQARFERDTEFLG